jgi:hypothetical protein
MAWCTWREMERFGQRGAAPGKRTSLVWCVGLWWLGLASGCQHKVALSAELVTDLSADIDGIYVDRARGVLTGAAACSGASGNVFDRTLHYREGAVVGAETRVKRGETWTVRVTLCHGSEVLVHRSVQARIERDTQLRIVIADQCFQNGCEAAPPCDYTQCEQNIACHWGNLSRCESPCGPGAPCDEGMECVSGECLRLSPQHDSGVDGGGQLDAESETDRSGEPSEGGAPDEQGQQPEGAGMDGSPEDTMSGQDAATDADPEAADANELADADARVQPEAAIPTPFDTYSEASKARVLFVGDALAAEALDTVRYWVLGTGKAEWFDSIAGRVALCDFLENDSSTLPVEKRLAAAVTRSKPQLVIMQFWGDARTPCMDRANDPSVEAYYDRYIDDGRAAVRTIEQAALAAHVLGTGNPRPRIMWVLQPPDRDNRSRGGLLNLSFAALATEFGDAVCDAGYAVSKAADPADASIADRNTWVQYLPCNDYERGLDLCTDAGATSLAKLHRDDRSDGSWDYLQSTLFCLGSTGADFACDQAATSPGIARYGMSIAHDANLWLGLTEN